LATRYEVRTFEDIINACLEEIGESTSNTKMVQRLKRDINAVYINEVVPAHNWTWLKRRLEVQTEPYFSTGTASVTSNSVTVTLTESPAKSYKGYYFASDGHTEYYRIAQHTASSSTVTLESPYTGDTDTSVNFKIWSDNVPLPSDVLETIEVSHAYQKNPLEGRGPQEFERLIAAAPRAQGRPRVYSTGEKVQPDKYETVSSLPASATRASSGRIRTIKYASSLGASEDVALLRPGDKIEVSGSSSYTYNMEAVVVELSTTTNTNDTIKYIAEENLNESSTADTGITIKLAPQDAKLFEYRPLFYYPAQNDSRTTLRVQALIEPTPLEEDEDEPLMPITDRMVLVYGALARGWTKARDDHTGDKNEGKFQMKLAKMAGRIEDSIDKPRIVISSDYRRAKYKKSRGYSVPSLDSNVGSGGGAMSVTGTASRVAIFNSDGNLVSDSNISTTELGYLNNVSSNIQTQLDAKLGSQGTSTDEAVIRWNGTSGNSLQDSALSISDLGVATLTGSLAVDNLKLDGNTLSSTDTNGNINLTPDGTGLVVAANAKVSNLSTGVVHADADGDLTSSAIVNADVDAAAAIAYSKLNLATSIVNADVAAAAAIARSKLGTGTADHVLINAADGTFSSEAALAITRGGTGQATATAAFDALAPTTAKGDLVVHNGTDNVRVAVGSDTHVLTADSNEAGGVKWAAPAATPAYLRGKNYAQNAQFRFFQRQAPATLTSRQDDQYGPDRWYVLTSGGAVNVQTARVEESVSGENNRYVCQVRQADATARQIGIAQIIEFNDILELREQDVTFSVFLRTDGTEIPALRAGVVEWTGTADSVTSDIVSSWAATPTLIANAAFLNTPADFSTNGTFAEFSTTVTVGATANNLILFIWTPNAEDQNEDFYVANVELVLGSERAEWAEVSLQYSEDLRQCQKFYEKNFSIDVAPGTVTNEGSTVVRASGTTVAGTDYYKQTKRAVPTVTFYSGATGASGKVRDSSTPADVNATATDAGVASHALSIGAGINSGGLVRWFWTAEAEL
jgi:hypothetical protein